MICFKEDNKIITEPDRKQYGLSTSPIVRGCRTLNDLFQRRQQNNYGTGQKTIWIKHISDCQGL